MDFSDHRSIANRQDLFHLQEEGPGVIFWHPRGYSLYRVIEDYIRKQMQRAGFKEIKTPQLLSRAIWETSGHWQKFNQNMFCFEEHGRAFALKPMSCPGHLQIFKERLRSFRDLPMRYFEFGSCHRNELSGSLQGLLRTRAFTQDDAHILCSEAMVEQEVARFYQMLKRVYADFGFVDFQVGLSTRPVMRAGSDEVWDRAEAMLMSAARAAGIEFKLQPGEGAFYGPKLEFILSDNQHREWQCGTIQLDYFLPRSFEANFIDSDGDRKDPVMLHHAVLGSLERFIGMLLEHYQGALPFWLAPDQIVVCSINEAQAGYAGRVAEELQANDLRVVLDIRNESLAKKIVDAREAGIAIIAVVGPREAQQEQISIRYRNGKQQIVNLAAAIELFRSNAVD